MGSQRAKKEPEKSDQAFVTRCLLLVLFLGTIILFAPVRGYDFINYDDNTFVYENPHIVKGLTADGLYWAFTSADIDYWRPLSWVTHMLDVELFGMNAGGHHIVNVLFHALGACALFLMLGRMTGRLWPAAIVAGLFAWHPLHVESVAWISERKDVLCGFFWFTSLYLYARYAERPGIGRYALVFVAFLLGLMSKPMIITLPCQMLLLDVWPLKRIALDFDWSRLTRLPMELWCRARQPLLEKLPFFAVVLISCAATFSSQREVGTMSSVDSLSVERRLQNVPAAYFNYLAKTILPLKLAVFYPLLPEPEWAKFAAGIALVVGLSIFAVSRLRTAPWLAVGWFWFLGTLVPVIGFVQVGGQSHADRYTYVALVGIFVAIVWSVAAWIGRAAASRMIIGKYATGLSLVACLIVSRGQLQHWQSGDTMFRHALEVTEDNHIACYNLARLHLRRSEYPQAVELLRQADKILPNTPDILLNLGTALHEGQISMPEARATYLAAVAAAPESPLAYNNLGNLSSGMGRHEEAVGYYEKALELDPEYFDTLYNYAGTLLELRRFTDAAAAYDRALKLSPRDLDVRNGLITALSSSGNFAEAMGLAMETADLYPDRFEPNYNAGVLLQQAQQDGHAVSYYERALRINPDYLPGKLAVARLLATSADEKTRNPMRSLGLLDDIQSQLGRPDFRLLEVRAEALRAMGKAKPAKAVLQQAAQLARETGATADAERIAKSVGQ
jgi:protein O-mannosyl-transferase